MVTNINGEPSFHIAARYGYSQVVRVLEEYETQESQGVGVEGNQGFSQKQRRERRNRGVVDYSKVEILVLQFKYV